MTITTRASKGSALTHNELDTNFTSIDSRIGSVDGRVTTLGVTNLTDGSESLDVSSMIVQTSLNAKGTNFDDIHFTRIAGTGDGTEDLVSMLLETDYSVNSHNLADNQSAGFFGWIRTANKGDVLGGGTKWITDNVVDTNNFNTYVQLTCYNTVGGTRSEHIYELGPDVAKLQKVMMLTPTPYDELPPNTGSADDGMVAFMTYDGAGTPKWLPIFSVGGEWRYFHDTSTVDDGQP